ncbi:Protein disulfide isomerase-like 1-3 [Sticta canariensis]|nr:Protein disulfide isomerase-like 1-3 [Sticta canariensis]
MQIKTLLSCLLILTLTAFSAQAQDDIEIDESDVLDLTEASFDKIISETKYVLAEFMAPWCGHCKSLKPHYAEAASALKENTPPVALAKIDATEEKALAERYEVKGFPTLLWFVDGKPTPYTGGRTADTIVRWISKRTGPPAKTISTAAEYKEAVSGQRLALLAYFDAFEHISPCNVEAPAWASSMVPAPSIALGKAAGPDYEAFTSAAQQEDGVEFLQTSTKEVAAAAGIKASPPTFALSTAFVGFEPAVVQSKGHAAFTGDTLAEDLASFLLAEKLPPFIEFSQSTQQQIFGSGIDKQQHVVCLQLKGKFAVVTSPLESEGSAPVANFFGADASSKELQVRRQLSFVELHKQASTVIELVSELIAAHASAQESVSMTMGGISWKKTAHVYISQKGARAF